MLTGLPFVSCTWTVGWRVRGTPLCAVAAGAVTRASLPAAAAVMVKGALVPVASPVAAAVRV